MDIQSVKIDLIHWLSELEDVHLLKQLSAFKEKSTNAQLKKEYTERAIQSEQDIKKAKVYSRKEAEKEINSRLGL